MGFFLNLETDRTVKNGDFYRYIQYPLEILYSYDNKQQRKLSFLRFTIRRDFKPPRQTVLTRPKEKKKKQYFPGHYSSHWYQNRVGRKNYFGSTVFWRFYDGRNRTPTTAGISERRYRHV